MAIPPGKSILLCASCPAPAACAIYGCGGHEARADNAPPVTPWYGGPVPSPAPLWPDPPPAHWAEACPSCGYLAGAHSHGCPQS